jgi:dTMP kinase
MPLNWVIQANALSTELLKPDLNIFIDISPEVSTQRLKAGRNSFELYETIENLRNVKAKYMEAFEIFKLNEKVFITDGNRSEKKIADDIWQTVSGLLAANAD